MTDPLRPRQFNFSDWQRSFALQAVGLNLAQVTIRDFAGNIRLWTLGMERLYGYTAMEAIGQISHRLLKTVFPRPLPEIEALLRTHGEWSGELLHTTRDGRKIWVSTQWALTVDQESNDFIISEENHDITELKRTRTRQALFLDTFQSSQDAIILKSLDGTILEANLAVERIFGYMPEELIGQSVSLLIPDDLQPQENDIIGEIHKGNRIEHFETIRKRKNGELFEVSLSISPVHNENGKIIGAAKIARDITERNNSHRKMQSLLAELAHLDRVDTMGQMASAIAHELNQPLTALLGYLGAASIILKQRGSDTDPIRTSVEAAKKQAQRSSDVVARLRNYLRPGAGERQNSDFNDLVREAVELGSFGKSLGHIVVDYDLATDIPIVLIDRVQICQVIVNLVRNAVEAMETSPVKVLSVKTKRSPERFLELTVEDSGCGIDPAIQALLFQPFTTSKPHGMGIGLSICRDIVEAHGGRMWVGSKNQGTIFGLMLPLEEEE